MKLKKETLRWPRGQDKITSRCVHVLGFAYALYFINYLCFFLTFHRVRTNTSGGAEPAQYGLEINFNVVILFFASTIICILFWKILE